MGATACGNGVSEMRRRERILHERQTQQRLVSEPEQQEPEPELKDENPEKPEGSEQDKPDKKRCPDCPKNSDDFTSELLPERGRHAVKRIKPKPVPFPVPPEEPEN